MGWPSILVKIRTALASDGPGFPRRSFSSWFGATRRSDLQFIFDTMDQMMTLKSVGQQSRSLPNVEHECSTISKKREQTDLDIYADASIFDETRTFSRGLVALLGGSIPLTVMMASRSIGENMASMLLQKKIYVAEKEGLQYGLVGIGDELDLVKEDFLIETITVHCDKLDLVKDINFLMVKLDQEEREELKRTKSSFRKMRKLGFAEGGKWEAAQVKKRLKKEIYDEVDKMFISGMGKKRLVKDIFKKKLALSKVQKIHKKKSFKKLLRAGAWGGGKEEKKGLLGIAKLLRSMHARLVYVPRQDNVFADFVSYFAGFMRIVPKLIRLPLWFRKSLLFTSAH